MARRSFLVLAVLALVAAACNGDNGGDESPVPAPSSPTSLALDPPVRTPSTTVPPTIPPEGTVERFVPEVLSIRPHDSEAFTQGLLIEDGRLFESTGLYGSSTLREVDPVTGEVIRSVAMEDSLFAEGLELVDDRLVMLTFQEGKALVFQRDTFEVIDQFSYATEGWGLCFDGEHLVMSDGTATLVFRDPETFAEVGKMTVAIGGQRVEGINELECVDGQVWANIWLTDLIYRIDPNSGRVTGVVDASGLLAEPPDDARAVLNGIAFDESSASWLVTGKLWPSVFEVRFVPEPS